NPNLKHLTESNFDASIKNGMWLIELYSPYCGHCKHFAPLWQDLAEYNEHLEDSSDFHMARINCISQGDLCQKLKVEGYPSLFLFSQGSFVEKYEEEREWQPMLTYIEMRAADYR
ncbi:thioredoxin-like protein, partial [Violaceomyces palustris]